MLETLARYQIESGVAIRGNEKVCHGYWTLQMKSMGEGLLDVWESSADGTRYVPGAELTLTYWIQQHEACRLAGGAFSPPLPDQKIAVSAGVLAGVQPVEGVRYPAPPHMSGWYLTTDQYSGNVRDLQIEHLYHLTAARPELARYIALPPGYRFFLAGAKESVVLDEAVLRQ